MKVMFLFRSFLNSLDSLTQITKKIFMVIVVFGIIFAVFISVIDKNRVVINPQKEILKQRAQIYNTLNQLSTHDKNGLVAYKMFNCFTMGEACTDNPADGDKNSRNSVIGMATSLIALPYVNPPASGTLYTMQKFSDIGLFPKTYAATEGGIGFDSLSIFRPIWQAFRDLTFLLLVIILVVVGFMIMFRMKLDPHTVVNVENALPKIILTMVLITFSYAIAGFLIDAMYVSVILVINVLAKPGDYTSSIASMSAGFLTHDLIGTEINGTNIFAHFFGIYFNGLYGILDILPPMMRFFVNLIVGFAGVILILRIGGFVNPIMDGLMGHWEAGGSFFATGSFKFGDLIGTLASLAIGFFISSIIFSIVIGVIVILGVLLLLLRIFFVLLSCYIQIIVHILFAPLLLLMEAIPGQHGFMPWLRNMVGNLSVFPVTIGLILIVYIINTKIGNVAGFSANGGLNPDPKIIWGTQYGGNQNQMFLPPLMVLTPEPFLAVIDAAFLIMIPDLIKLVKQKIIGKDSASLPIGPGSLISGSIGGVIGGGMGMFNQFGSFSHGLTGVQSILGKFKPLKPGDPGGPDGPPTPKGGVKIK